MKGRFLHFLAAVFLMGSAVDGGAVQLAQVTIEQRLIIRIPLVPARPPAAPPREAPAKWKEKKGPECIALRSIRGAEVVATNGVDLILMNGQRYRARLQRGCRSAYFYSGFYIEPSEDRALCAGRDDLQARGGASCEIDSFKELVEDR